MRLLIAYQAAVQYGARRPGQPDIAGFHGVNGERGRVNEVSQFVCEKTQLLIPRLNAFIRSQ